MNKLTLTLSILSAAAESAYGQSVADVSRAQEATATFESRYNTETDNLRAMVQTLTGDEFLAADFIINSSDEIYAYFEGVSVLAYLVTHSECANDLPLHRKALDDAANSLVKRANLKLPLINRALTLTKTPAVSEEATKLRDLIVETRNVYKPFTSKD